MTDSGPFKGASSMMKFKAILAVLIAFLMAAGLAFPAHALGARMFDHETGNWIERPEPIASRQSPIKREMVDYQTNLAVGTIVVETSERRLYFVLGDGKAVKYGIGVGQEGMQWAGTNRVSRKAEWPDWRPTANMIRRDPSLPRFMPGGPENPLGARALYIGSTMYRLHGTAEPWTIGHAVSSGCIRLTNEDIMDLYERVKVGAQVIVRR